MLTTILSFGLAIIILVAVHEFGHYFVARKCGVKVLRFAIGLGSPIFSFKNKEGTEIALSPIPLGGYVKMLDERESPVIEAEKHLAFNNKSVWQRMAIVIAGPAANFVLAILLFWILAMLGNTYLRPVIGKVVPNSLAYQAAIAPNTEIIKINHDDVHNWTQISHALISKIGSSGNLVITTKDLQTERISEHTLYLNNWLRGSYEPDLLQEIGIIAWQPKIPIVLAQIDPKGPAFNAGLLIGDEIFKANDIEVNDWSEFVELIRPLANQKVQFTIKRNNQVITQEVILGERADSGYSYLGTGVKAIAYPEEMLKSVSYNPLAAIYQGFSKTYELSVLTLQGLGKMLTGALSIKNISGPITIAKIAGATWQTNISAFMHFVAYLSISLGVLNLLPIPVLDGGHLVFYIIEAIRGKTLSDGVQTLTTQIGMCLIMGLIFIALFNDVNRLIS